MTNANQPQNYLAQTDDEALQRFECYKSKDPFPDIAPALLNSADICDYVAATGMIYPFDSKKLKSASYAVPILGKLIYWDEQGKKQILNMSQSNQSEILNKRKGIETDEFTLKKNSIAFVTLQPMFRLPDYIAIRFNLKITHVYRGLLLGTGPLVDPGFTGRLSIPLHNLTNNDYTFSVAEDLIWMEFTKLSPNKRWKKRMIGDNLRQGDYVEFRNDPNADVEDYLHKAIKSPCPYSIRSSIPEVFQNAEKAATDAANTLKLFQGIGAISILGLIITLGALFFQVFSLVREKDDVVNKTNNQLELLQKTITNMQDEINTLKKELNTTKKEPSRQNIKQ
jgi:deoxycytidine triphosphate deaminase